MKKVFLALALVVVLLVSCKKVEAPARLTTVDSVAVKVDSVQVDSTVVDTTEVGCH